MRLNSWLSGFLGIAAIGLVSQGVSRADIIDLTFAGTYDATFGGANPPGGTVFGSSSPATPFDFTIQYNTSVGPDVSLQAGEDVPGMGVPTNTPLYGFTSAGIVPGSFQVGDQTFSTADIVPEQESTNVNGSLVESTASEAIWSDTDLANLPPGINAPLVNVYFQNPGGNIIGLVGSDITENSFTINNLGDYFVDANGDNANANTITISAAEIPEPSSALGLGIVGLLGLLGRRRIKPGW